MIRISIAVCRWLLLVAIVSAGFCQSTAPVGGQTRDRLLPSDIDYDGSIQSPKEYFGFEIGSRHLRHDQVVSYLRTLDQQSDRVQLFDYGQSHDGRPLILLTIAAPERLDYLSEIQQQHRLLAHPERSAEVDRQYLPVVVSMGYGVHGDEPSATNSSLLVAYWLAAGQSPQVDAILQDTVILLDPCLNPDGFDRFAHWQATYRGRQWNPDPNHAEHRQGWPSGRTNYYWFDLNRDWLPVQHPESRARVKWYHQWKPNVVLDYHEMGTRATYFFQPGVPSRANPLIPSRNLELTQEIAKFHARALDQQRSLYYTEEGFDDFYPGKGSTYPDLHGGVGILFEQASSRGQVQENQHGLLTFSKTISNQLTTSLSSLEAAVAHRQELLEYKVEFYRDAWEQAQQSTTQTLLFTAPGNRSRLQELADLLLRHDIQCYWLRDSEPIGELPCDARYTLVVPWQQPETKFLQALIEPQTEFRDNEFYDISAWSIPLAFGVEQHQLAERVPQERLALAKIGQRLPSQTWGDLIASPGNPASDSDTVEQTAAPESAADESHSPPVAYAIDWREDVAPTWLVRLLKEQYYVQVALRPFTGVVGRNAAGEPVHHDFLRGTLIVPLAVQKRPQANLEKLLPQLQRAGLAVYPLVDGLTPRGPDLGSRSFSGVTLPEAAMLIGGGASAYQAGEVWHHFDTRLQLRLTLLSPPQWQSSEWDRYQTIVVPSGSYSPTSIQYESLTRWVRGGGTLIVIGSAVGDVGKAVVGKDVIATGNLAANPPVAADKKLPSSESNPNGSAKSFSMEKFDPEVDAAVLRQINGAIFDVAYDDTHPLFFGISIPRLPVFRSGTTVLVPANPSTQNPAYYDRLLSGYASSENQQRLANTPAVAIHQLGSGRVILFADDPLFRAYWFGTARLFNNALLFGPTMSASGGGGEGDELDAADESAESDD